MSDQVAINEAAGKYWGERLAATTPKRIRWWEDETTCRHINRIVLGEPIDGLHAGFHERLAQLLKDSPARRALSVGCGTGSKEWDLIRRGIVGHFDLYDISAANIEHGKKHAEEQGLASCVTYHLADAFKADVASDYDLVYWNNALHHMPDVHAAVSWSFNRLKPFGLFAIDDFVGPSRFQWTDENLRWANAVRNSLPERFLENPWSPGTLVGRQIVREPPESVIAVDPSEAADSGRIIEAIKKVFPDANIHPTGGALYHTALNDIFCNFKTDDDLALLRQILMLDQHLAENGTTQYGVAFARKSPEGIVARLARRIAGQFGR